MGPAGRGDASCSRCRIICADPQRSMFPHQAVKNLGPINNRLVFRIRIPSSGGNLLKFLLECSFSSFIDVNNADLPGFLCIWRTKLINVA